MRSVITIFVMKASLRNATRTTRGSNCGCCCLLFQKKTVKHSVQCHVLVQSPPDRRPNDKYPVNTSHRSDWYSNVSLQYYLVATVIHVQYVRSQICVYIYTCSAQFRDSGLAM